MKLQMKLSKILSIFTTGVAVLAFIMALGLCTDIYNIIEIKALGLSIVKQVNNYDIFDKIQPFNQTLVSLCITLIILSVLIFITRTNIRRRYYVSNYVAGGVVGIGFIAISIIAILGLIKWRNYYNNIDFNKIDEIVQTYKQYSLFEETYQFKRSTLFIDLNIFSQVLVLITGLLVIGNLIWKTMLMKFETQLLNNVNSEIEFTSNEASNQ